MGIASSIEGQLWVNRVMGSVSWVEVADRICDQMHRHEYALLSLWDLSLASVDGWDLDVMLAFAERVKAILVNPTITALVAPSPETYGAARLALAILCSRTRVEGHVFSSEARARAWLGTLDHHSAVPRAAP